MITQSDTGVPLSTKNLSKVVVNNLPALIPWLSRKSITLTGSTDGALTSHQIRITVNAGVGADSGKDVYLNGNAKADFSDVFFADSAGNPLDYFLETPFDANKVECMVRVPSLPASPATYILYVYYNRSSGISASNGTATFPDFFDDFINTNTHITPVSTDSGQNGGFDPVSRRLYNLAMETGDGVGIKAGMWVNIDTWETGLINPGHPSSLIISGVAYHPVKKLFYVYGGINSYNGIPYSSQVVSYDPALDVWAVLTETIPLGLANIEAIYDPVSEDIFLFGGSTGILLEPRAFVDTINRHDVTAGTITDTTAVLNNPSWGARPQYVNGLIYLLGGLEQALSGFGTSLDTIYTYDPANPANDPVLLGDTLSVVRDTAITWTIGTDIYIAGGWITGSNYQDTIDKLNTLTGTVTTLAETIYTADDDGSGIYDPVNNKTYLWPMRHSSSPAPGTPGDDAFKRVVLEFDTDTETFLPEPDLGSVPAGWTSTGSDATQPVTAINKSYMSLQDFESATYVRAEKILPSELIGKKTVDYMQQNWAYTTGGFANSSYALKETSNNFNADDIGALRMESLDADIRIVTGAGNVNVGTNPKGFSLWSLIVDTVSGEIFGELNYGPRTPSRPYRNAGKLAEQIWVHTPSSELEGFIFDWVRVRNWTSNEPAYGTWGAEEPNPPQPT